MKYLVVARQFFESDNNTPSDKVWVKITELEPADLARAEKVYIDEFNEDDPIDVNITFYPVSEVDEEWIKITEIW